MSDTSHDHEIVSIYGYSEAQIDKLTDVPDQPNGICFSPDYKKIYVADTGNSRNLWVGDIDGKSVRNFLRPNLGATFLVTSSNLYVPLLPVTCTAVRQTT